MDTQKLVGSFIRVWLVVMDSVEFRDKEGVLIGHVIIGIVKYDFSQYINGFAFSMENGIRILYFKCLLSFCSL